MVGANSQDLGELVICLVAAEPYRAYEESSAEGPYARNLLFRLLGGKSATLCALSH
jgi:hypothetical protein